MTQTGGAAWGVCGLGEVPGLHGLLQGGECLLPPLWAWAQVELSLGRAGAQSSFYPKPEKLVCSRRKVSTEMTHLEPSILGEQTGALSGEG